MATFYVWSGATGLNDGSSWTDAYTTIAPAITASVNDGDTILIHYTHQEQLAADTTYTLNTGVTNIISVDKDNSNVLTSMYANDTLNGWLGNSTANRSMTFTGTTSSIYMWGITFRIAGGSADNVVFTGASVDFEIENCFFRYGGTNNTCSINLGSSGEDGLVVRLIDCKFDPVTTNQSYIFYLQEVNLVEIINFQILGGSNVDLFNCNASAAPGCNIYVMGTDLSSMNASGFALSNSTVGGFDVKMINCKLPASWGGMDTQTADLFRTSNRLTLIDCASGDEHYHFRQESAVGTIRSDTGVYQTQGASYDGTNKFSWRIDSTSEARWGSQLTTPWLDLYWDGTGSISPYIEILRTNTTTPLKDDEIWMEVMYKGTSGSTLGTHVKDRATPNEHFTGTASNQSNSSLSSTDWVGESGTDWYGVLSVGSITPAEAGWIRARVHIAHNTGTNVVYIDPQIRF